MGAKRLLPRLSLTAKNLLARLLFGLGAWSREAIFRQADEALEAERRSRERESLKAVTERLDVGVLMEEEGGLTAANGVMEAFGRDCGDLSLFANEGSEPLELRDCHDRLRQFEVRRLAGSPTFLVREVTALVEAARERHLFAKLPAASPNPLFRLNSEGRVEYANAAGSELLHYMGGELSGALEAEVRKVCSSGEGKSIELRVGPRIFTFAIALIDGGEFLYLYGTDVTERRFAEEALRRSEERFRSLLAAAPDAILIVDSRGVITYANPEAGVVFNRAPETLEGERLHAIIPLGEDRPDLGEGVQWGRSEGVMLMALRAPATLFPVEVSISLLERDQESAHVLIVRDVTERERNAREIRRLNSDLQTHVAQLTALNRELEAFSYSVSHDLRSPLRTIGGYSSILLEEYAERLDPQGRDFLGKIISASGYMARLIDDLLRLSRISRMELKRLPTDLSALAGAVADRLRQAEPERKVTFVIAPGITVSGDPSLLEVVFENLLGNAWKFTSNHREARIEFGCTDQPGKRVLFVRDDGAGFDMAYSGKLFSAFERLHLPTEFPGTGIGLATVQRIVRKHGGEIWAEGEVEKGATFYFTLSPENSPLISHPG